VTKDGQTFQVTCLNDMAMNINQQPKWIKAGL